MIIKMVIKVLFVLFLYVFEGNCSIEITENQQSEEIFEDSSPQKDEWNSFLSVSQMVKKTISAVVSINAIGERETISPFGNDPFFGLFFGPQSYTSRSSGSGVIVDSRGYIVTCAHVIQNAKTIKVTLGSGLTLKASIILMDDKLDLAVLKLDMSKLKIPLPFLKLSKETIEVGDPVIAIGNAFGVGQTVTHGIISAGYRVFGNRVMIQTDSPINPGNSGGPMLTPKGDIIGIANAIASRTGASHGVGFFIPAIAVQYVLNRAILGAKIPRIPIKVQTVDPSVVEALNDQGFSMIGGCVVTDLLDKECGIQVGDIILSVGEQDVTSKEMFDFFSQMVPVKEKYALKFIRMKDMTANNKPKIQVSYLESQEKVSVLKNNQDIIRLEGNHFLKGVTVANITPEIVESLDLGIEAKGVIVLDTSLKNSFIKKNDIILQLNGLKVDNIKGLQNILKESPKELSLIVKRGNMLVQRYIQTDIEKSIIK